MSHTHRCYLLTFPIIFQSSPSPLCSRVVTGLLHHVVWASLDPNMAEYLKAYMECFFALAEKHIR